jgi:hypothetical protein
MLSKAFEHEFLKSLSLLSNEQQNKVLFYMKALLRTENSSQRDLLQFAGSIDPENIQEMSKAIEAGCENIDKNEW